MEPINPKSSHHMTSLDKWTVSTLQWFLCPRNFVKCLADLKCMLLQAWCSQHHQGDLSATPDKHEAFVTQLYTEALSSLALVDPARYYQNNASSIHTKLLKRHGYAEPDSIENTAAQTERQATEAAKQRPCWPVSLQCLCCVQ